MRGSSAGLVDRQGRAPPSTALRGSALDRGSRDCQRSSASAIRFVRFRFSAARWRSSSAGSGGPAEPPPSISPSRLSSARTSSRESTRHGNEPPIQRHLAMRGSGQWIDAPDSGSATSLRTAAPHQAGERSFRRRRSCPPLGHRAEQLRGERMRLHFGQRRGIYDVVDIACENLPWRWRAGAFSLKRARQYPGAAEPSVARGVGCHREQRFSEF
jgi:hypothetical protein